MQELFRGKRAVLVASTGGHLAQMARLVPRLGVEYAHLVTFQNAQSLSVAESFDDVEWIPYVAPRGVVEMARCVPRATALFRRVDADIVLSTGAGVAVPYLTVARGLGIESVYLESVSRLLGPSLAGRLLRRAPGVRTYTQHEHLVDERWLQGPCLLDDFEVVAGSHAAESRTRVFITLGTIRPYRFDRLLDRLVEVLPAQWEMAWQVGCSGRSDLPGRVEAEMSAGEFDEHVRAADVVVSHAGVGSALRIMELGKSPVLVPREAARGEHVDDHQTQIAEHLSTKGLAVMSRVGDLTLDHVVEARSRLVREAPGPFGGAHVVGP